jgi:hypothetical protein
MKLIGHIGIPSYVNLGAKAIQLILLYFPQILLQVMQVLMYWVGAPPLIRAN